VNVTLEQFLHFTANVRWCSGHIYTQSQTRKRCHQSLRKSVSQQLRLTYSTCLASIVFHNIVCQCVSSGIHDDCSIYSLFFSRPYLSNGRAVVIVVVCLLALCGCGNFGYPNRPDPQCWPVPVSLYPYTLLRVYPFFAHAHQLPDSLHSTCRASPFRARNQSPQITPPSSNFLPRSLSLSLHYFLNFLKMSAVRFLCDVRSGVICNSCCIILAAEIVG